MRRMRGLIVAGLALALASGCSGGSQPEASDKPARKAAAAGPAGKDAKLTAKAEDYHYDPTGKRDPFVSFVKSLVREQAGAVASPLERFDLSQLTVSAIVWGTEKPRALVLDPQGKGYIVGEGTPIGKNDGKIVRIGDNTVVVKETYVDFLGKATTKDIEMRVHGGKGG